MASKEIATGRRSKKDGTTSNVKLSKLLSYILRHGAVKEGFEISTAGFVNVKHLLQHSRFKGYALDDIRQVVSSNEKQRFDICEENGEVLIRANQGHSIDVPDLELTKLEKDEVGFAIHGTYDKCIPIIKRDGLSRMKRQHIHMALCEPGTDGVISGMRQSCDYIVRVNITKAQDDGLEFYKSKNNVILCSGDENGYILPKYFDSIRKRK